MARQSAPGTRVAFRKKKKPPVKLSEEEKNLKTELPQQPNLAELYGTRRECKPPVLLVDGYNVLFKMVEKEKKSFENLDLEGCRSALEDDMLLYSQTRGIQVAIVYDGQGCAGDDSPLTRETKSGMEIIFCKTLEADIGLMMEATKCLMEGTPYVTIATSDNAAKIDCSQPPTAFVVSSELLLKEIKQCKEQLNRALQENQSQYRPGRLGGAVGADHHSDIRKLRNQLL